MAAGSTSVYLNRTHLHQDIVKLLLTLVKDNLSFYEVCFLLYRMGLIDSRVYQKLVLCLFGSQPPGLFGSIKLAYKLAVLLE
jgi:hypothetical protein